MNVWKYLEKHDLTDIVCEGLDRLNFNSDKVDDVMSALGRFQLVVNYRAKSRFGQFDPNKRTIELTSEYFNGDWELVKEDHHNTLLHEVAHLVVHFVYRTAAGNVPVYRRRGNRIRQTNSIQAHGREWKSVMRAFGLAPERCGKSDILADAKDEIGHKHSYTCEGCGHEYKTMRKLVRLNNRFHGPCGQANGRLVHRQLR